MEIVARIIGCVHCLANFLNTRHIFSNPISLWNTYPQHIGGCKNTCIRSAEWLLWLVGLGEGLPLARVLHGIVTTFFRDRFILTLSKAAIFIPP